MHQDTDSTQSVAERKNQEARHRLVMHRALMHLKRLKAQVERYEDDVREWYTRGDGRAPHWVDGIGFDGEPYRHNLGGRGHRYPACIHGTSRWTAYDNICGPCEDGIGVYEHALMAAYDDVHQYYERIAVFHTARKADAPDEIQTALADWALEPLL